MRLSGYKFKIAIVVCVIVLAAVIVLVSPIFYIEEVVILGNAQIASSEIRGGLQLGPTSNILMFNASAARRRVMQNLYIDNVIFRRDLPNRLYVTVFERRQSAYVEHMGSFLFLDIEGRVLEVRSYVAEPLPLLQGLQFTRVQLGDVLEVANPTDFAAVVQYTQLLATHGLINYITHINVADPTNIRILVNYLEFHVGNDTDADEKVRTIAEILNELPDAGRVRGFINIRTIQPEFFLELLQ